MNFDYDQATSKQLTCPSPYDNRPANIPQEQEDLKLTKEDLIKLVSYLECELDAKENSIRRLKEERANNLLHEAKYGRITAGDPFTALRRDSDITDERLDEDAIGELYVSQLVQLEKMCNVHKKTAKKAQVTMANMEKRHDRIIREVELDRERKSAYAAQGDDVVAFLEREREKLQQQVEYQINEVAIAKKEAEKLERCLEQEKDRHKTMILFLINERKQMLVKMHELRVKGELAPASALPPMDAGLLEELKKELVFLRKERDQLKSMNKSMKAENLSLKEVVKGQEADLLLLRRNMLSANKIPIEKHNTVVEGSLVVANRMAAATQPQRSTTRLSNSSSFPSEKSRLPRAPSSPARAPSNQSRSLLSPRVPLSPTKKTPAMGIGMGTVRQRPSASSSTPKYNPEPELQQLEEAIQGLEQQANGVGMLSSPTKRSNSLTRGKSEPTKMEPSMTGGVYRTEPGKGLTPTAGLRPPTKVEKPVERKLSGTLKKSSLLKAFGGGK